MPDPPPEPGRAKRLFAAATMRATGGDAHVFADELARSSISDEDAVRQLRDRFGNRRAALKRAMGIVSADRSNYLGDRAFRLLRAVCNDRPIVGFDPNLADLFVRERDLGRMPLRDAMTSLAELEPRLAPLLSSQGSPVAFERGNREAMRSAVTWAREQIREMVGLRAESDDPLLRSDISMGVVETFLLSVGHHPDRLDLPYVDAGAIRMRVTSGAFGPGAQHRSRPVATN